MLSASRNAPPQAQSEAPEDEAEETVQPARGERAPKREGRGGRAPFGAKGERRVRTAERVSQKAQEGVTERDAQMDDEERTVVQEERIEESFILEKTTSEEIELDLDAQPVEEEDERFSD